MKATLSAMFKCILIFAFIVSMISTAQAGGTHAGEASAKMKTIAPPSPASLAENENNRSTKGKLVNVLYVDGYEVSVKIVDVKDSIPDGGTHNILVKIKLGDTIKRNDIVMVDVLFPDNTSSTKTLLELGDWYLAGFDMAQKGQHTISLLFKSSKNGDDHRTKFSYP